MNHSEALKILELSGNPSIDEIKKSYRQLALRYHPDKNQNDKAASEKFLKIQEAYEFLTDNRKENKFNPFEDVDAFFKREFFKFATSQTTNTVAAKPRPGSQSIILGDVDIGSFTLDLVDVLFKRKLKLNLKVKTVCKACLGDSSIWEKCNSCSGLGVRVVTRQTIMGTITQHMRCEVCSGNGWKRTRTCRTCKDALTHHKEKVVEFQLPAKFKFGQKLRLGAQGNENWLADDSDIILQPFVKLPDLTKLDPAVQKQLKDVLS